MDCNSIIYDVYYALEDQYYKSPFDISDIESIIIQKTIEKIRYYINYISPTKYSYITFDGVVPLAKMHQQRKRRYKSEFMASIAPADKPRLWNTTKITPGTDFMDRLSIEIMKIKSDNIYVSTSHEYGEGEQKIFEKIREDVKTNDTAAIYGLDADLIMLSLFHIEKMKEIYIFREAPKFKSIMSKKINENGYLFLDIRQLARSINYEMGNNDNDNYKLVYDYVFMCFFFGNDFLPHIVSLKLYANGMDIMMNAYKKIVKNNSTIIKNGEIDWKLLEYVINEMKIGEKERILKIERTKYIKDTNVGMIYVRDYVGKEEGWEERYKKQLRLNGNEAAEYKEGLEWVLKYYSGKEIDKGWKYGKDYGPLLSELSEISKIEKKEKEEEEGWIRAKVQLAYVLPKESHKIIGEETEKYLEGYKELYPKRIKYQWDYCRYLWEAHPILPEIPLEELLKWNKDTKHF
jgi:5'-3' exonuclease